MPYRIFSLLLIGTGLALAQANSGPLKEGDSIPDVKLRTEDDQEVSLRKLVAEKPTVLIFYRGGWCPFCNRHLSDLVGIEEDLEKAGGAVAGDQHGSTLEAP